MARPSPTEDARGVQEEDGREAGKGEGGAAWREAEAEQVSARPTTAPSLTLRRRAVALDGGRYGEGGLRER